jgi:putative flippase GtrA
MVPEFLRFAVVGAVGFLANAVAVTAASYVVDLYTTGGIGWLVAVTVTWYLNRNWTFRRAQKRGTGTERVNLYAQTALGSWPTWLLIPPLLRGAQCAAAGRYLPWHWALWLGFASILLYRGSWYSLVATRSA